MQWPTLFRTSANLHSMVKGSHTSNVNNHKDKPHTAKHVFFFIEADKQMLIASNE